MKWVDKIYIISLSDATLRKDRIWNDLLSAGFNKNKIEWVEAINGNDLDINKSLEDGIISTKFRDPNGLLSKSIYGCALSHQKVYEEFLKTSEDIKTALVLEDDACLTHTALRTLIPNSSAYDYFINDVENVDWGVIQLGGVDKQTDYIEDSESNTKVIKKGKYPEYGWTAHSYIINKDSAKKLIENNKPIQYAADTNLYLSDTNLYTTVVSYFLQKLGNYPKWLAKHIENKVRKYVIYEVDEYNLEYQSKTINGDLIENKKDIINPMYQMAISKSIKPKKIEIEVFKANNGDVVQDWITIHLKSQ